VPVMGFRVPISGSILLSTSLARTPRKSLLTPALHRALLGAIPTWPATRILVASRSGEDLQRPKVAYFFADAVDPAPDRLPELCKA
jgi:hypothetical protein